MTTKEAWEALVQLYPDEGFIIVRHECQHGARDIETYDIIVGDMKLYGAPDLDNALQLFISESKVPELANV